MQQHLNQKHIDTTLSAFSHHRRREVLRVLQRERRMPFDELAEYVAAREADEGVGEPSDELIERVRISLYHTHIPKLAEARLVKYDRENEMVVLTRPAEKVDEYLDALTLQ